MNYCVIVSLVLSVCCGLRGAALPEQPVRDIKRTKLYAAICAKVQQHLLPQLAEKVAEYCDNDFPFVQKKFAQRLRINSISFLSDRYLLVSRQDSPTLMILDIIQGRNLFLRMFNKSPLLVVSHIRDNLVAAASPKKIIVRDIKAKVNRKVTIFPENMQIGGLVALDQNRLVASAWGRYTTMYDCSNPHGKRMVNAKDSLYGTHTIMYGPKNKPEGLCNPTDGWRIAAEDFGDPNGFKEWPRKSAEDDFMADKFPVLRGPYQSQPDPVDSYLQGLHMPNPIKDKTRLSCGGEIFMIQNYWPNGEMSTCDVYSMKNVEEKQHNRATFPGYVEGSTVAVSRSQDMMAFVVRTKEQDVIHVLKTTDDPIVEQKEDEVRNEWFERDLEKQEERQNKNLNKKKSWFVCG